MAELERDELLPPRSGPDVVYLIGPASTTRSVGNPSTIDRDRPFVGVTYLPPRGADAEGDPIGWMAWLQIDDPDLITILARWAVESRHAYAAP